MSIGRRIEAAVDWLHDPPVAAATRRLCDALGCTHFAVARVAVVVGVALMIGGLVPTLSRAGIIGDFSVAVSFLVWGPFAVIIAHDLGELDRRAGGDTVPTSYRTEQLTGMRWWVVLWAWTAFTPPGTFIAHGLGLWLIAIAGYVLRHPHTGGRSLLQRARDWAANLGARWTPRTA